MINKCVVCGSEFKAKTIRAKYCCKKCANHSRFTRTADEVRAENEMIKLELLKWYKKGLIDKEIAKKISKSTSWVQQTRNKMDLPRQGVKKLKKKEIHKQELAQMEVRFCKRCGSYFYPIRENQIFCSVACQRNMSHQINDIKRKRRVQEAYIDDIDLHELYRKYDGVCYLCGEQCDWNDIKYINGIPHTFGDYPSREHMVPLSKGGLHSWDNVRLAHIRCNSSKGVKYG